MDRLTHQGAKNTVVYGDMLVDLSDKYFPNKGVSIADLCYKLGVLEDTEQEIVIDLIILCKALKDGAWFVNKDTKEIYYAKATLISKISSHDFNAKQEDIKITGFLLLDQLIGWTYKLDEYGKTWALTKEELEDGI